MKIKYIDLFCGIGGMRLGFESALQSIGLIPEPVFSSEIKKHAIEAYKHNFNETPQGDITQINAKTQMPNFDFLLAGFPCQAFSVAGKRLGFEDTRGTLFFEIARILNEKKPKGFLLENVEGLATHNNGETLATMLGILTDLGYNTTHKILDSKDFGLAQSRKRIYIFGGLGRVINMDSFVPRFSSLSDIIDHAECAKHTEFTKKLLNNYDVKDILGKKIKDKRGGADNIHSWDFALKGEVSEEQKELLSLILKYRRNKKWATVHGIEWMDGMPLTLEMISTFYSKGDIKKSLDDLVEKRYLVYEHPKRKHNNKRVYDTSKQKGYNIVTGKLSFEYSKILNPADIVPTLVATDALRLGVPVADGIRPLTVKEGLRLFGFPKSYSLDFLDPKKAFDLLGNTVCIPVIDYAAKCVLKSVLNEECAKNVTVPRAVA